MLPTVHCTACGCAHDPRAHHDAAAMELEAQRATERGDGLAATIWRVRASCTRAGRIVPRTSRQQRLPEVA